ncbi:hypothetical protein O6H91_Y137400 [Diphasiastrum complanatum]|nr:hypothetical protein O6H91_Y137400 [Diphasiastrum complanatum]KAJ7296206.1 hypothetical protein O6H91_Y137400 [Diphasiastrum complanatum]KAJ7296207.1 hypothetical protein O6H91_Y137400 [Diphasiastrum complanatum]
MTSSPRDKIKLIKVYQFQKPDSLSRKVTLKQSTTTHISGEDRLANPGIEQRGQTNAPLYESKKTKDTDALSKLRQRQIRDLAFNAALERLLRRKPRTSQDGSFTTIWASPLRKTIDIGECSDSSASGSPIPSTKKPVAPVEGMRSIADSDVALIKSNLKLQDSRAISTRQDADISQKKSSAVFKEEKQARASAPSALAMTWFKEPSLTMCPDHSSHDEQPALLQKNLTITPELSRQFEPAKVRFKAADMAVEMREHAVCCAQQAVIGSEKPQFRRIASLLKKEFDRTYGPAWHCIAGSSFGSFVTHSVGGFVYFSIGKVSVLLFKTEVELIER